MSRPEKSIDWKLVDKLLLAGCAGTEIAPHFDMHPNTFYNKVQDTFNCGFSEYSAQKKSHGDGLLKVKQFEKALSGDNTMLVWLGKQRLGQKENLDKDAPPNDEKLTTLINEIKAIKERVNVSEPKTNPEFSGSHQTT